MKTFKVSIQISQKIGARDKDEALSIFWEDLHTNQEAQELAEVKELTK